MNLKNTRTIIISIFLLSAGLFFIPKNAIAGVPYDNCADWCENGGYGGTNPYTCGSNMCCTGHGCPSQGCPNDGHNWVVVNGQCQASVLVDSTTCKTWGPKYCALYEWEYNCTWSCCNFIGYCKTYCQSCKWEHVCQIEKRDCLAYVQYWTLIYAPLGSKYANSTCGNCPTEYDGSTPCFSSPMSGSFNVTAPAASTIYPSTQTSVTVTWGNTSSINWGVCCGSCTRVFDVFARSNPGSGWSAWSKVAGPVPSTTLSTSMAVSNTRTYEVFVRATNGSAGSIDSNHVTFVVSAPSVNVRGYIWDASGLACTGDKVSNEIQAADLSASFTPRITDSLGVVKSGTWNPAAYSGYSYNVANVSAMDNPQTFVASLPAPAGKPNFKYVLACVEGGSGSAISASSATITTSSNPTNVHLGYKLLSNGWFQAINGDVFGSCDESNCVSSVDVGVPATDVLGSFKSYLIAGVGTLFSDSGLSVSDDLYSEDSNRNLEYMGSSDPWPAAFTFSAPANAESITDCNGMFNGGGIRARKVYKASISCVEAGLSNVSGSYNLASEGVAVVFVEGTGTLHFNSEFKAPNDAKRVLFVVEGSVQFDTGLGIAAPVATALDPVVQAGFVVQDSVEFPTTGSQNDTTIVLEGPIVTKDGSVNFNRDRGLDNGYPAEVVVFNPIYIEDLQTLIDTGLSSVDIYWLLGE